MALKLDIKTLSQAIFRNRKWVLCLTTIPIIILIDIFFFFFQIKIFDSIWRRLSTTSQPLFQQNKNGRASSGPDASTVNTPSKDIVTPFPPLTDPVPDLPPIQYATTSDGDQNLTRVTTLSNGLKVASERKFGQFCTIGVVIESGARYEVAYPSGVSHFLEKLAFHVSV